MNKQDAEAMRMYSMLTEENKRKVNRYVETLKEASADHREAGQ